VHCRVRLPPQHMAVPAQWFSHIHVDLVGPLPALKGSTYVFTVIDGNTRWFKALSLNPLVARTTFFTKFCWDFQQSFHLVILEFHFFVFQNFDPKPKY
jgi:hypothetical protein